MALEEEIINLIATDKIYVPISSMGGKLERLRPKLAKQINLSEHNNNFTGKRVYARIESEDKKSAKNMREGIEKFKREFPEQGEILEKYIEEERTKKETHFYFGTNPECRLTTEDYLAVMKTMGFTEFSAIRLYPELLETSRALSRKRNEERSVLIG
ncbi:MAG: hypothetical protein ABIH28_00545 [archaeon]